MTDYNGKDYTIGDYVELAVIFYVVMWVLSFVFFLIWTPIKLLIWNAKHGEYERSHSAEGRPYAFTLHRAIFTPYVNKVAGGAAAIFVTLAIFVANIPDPKSYVWTDGGVAFVLTAPACAGLPFFIYGMYNELQMLFNYNKWVEKHMSQINAGTW